MHALLRYRSKTAKMQKFPIDSHSNENFICLLFRPPGAANPQTTSFPSLVFALPWAKISRRSHHPALRYPQPYKQTKTNKQKANLISRQTLRYATLYGEITMYWLRRYHIVHVMSRILRGTVYIQNFKKNRRTDRITAKADFNFWQFWGRYCLACRRIRL